MKKREGVNQNFVEAFYGKRALDWQPEDYERAEVLY
jgi:hypothetical protein